MIEACISCKHYNGRNENHRVVCIAFPNGAPDDITSGTNPHLKVHPNQDNDIVFEPIDIPSND